MDSLGESGPPPVWTTASSDETLEELTEPLAATEHVPTLAVGEVVASDDEESFTILRLLKGSSGRRLYEARQNDEEEPLWLWEGTGQTAERLDVEAAALRRVSCPTFPRFQANFRADGRTFLAIERCEGETFGEQLVAGKLQPREAVSVLSLVAFALTKLHAAGFVHHGLRPEVIVAARPAKLIDFADLTRVDEPPARAFYYAGYSPPELLRGEPADVRSDIYSIGAMLYHAVSGRPVAETGAELASWVLAIPAAGVPQILSRCLGAKETRYAAACELHRDLVRLVRRLTPPVRYTVGAATSIGLEPSRTTNQDAYTHCTGSIAYEGMSENWLMACVADGMGGMEAGDVASQAIVASLAQTAFAARSLSSAEVHASQVKAWIHEANEQVAAALETRRAKGGSTVVCACLVGNRLALGHVGDCRVYLVRAGAVRLLTRDHSLAMALVVQGELALEGVRTHRDRNTVTRSLGDRRRLPAYMVDGLEQVTGEATMELESGDTLLLCSDGVWEPLDEPKLLALLSAHCSDVHSAAEAIVAATLAEGGGDNATAVVIRLG